MKMQIVVLGVILLIAGAVVAVLFGATNILGGRTHQIIPAGGIGIAVIGVIITALGATSKISSPAGQFKCQSCGATFGSEAALKSHSKDKHGT